MCENRRMQEQNGHSYICKVSNERKHDAGGNCEQGTSARQPSAVRELMERGMPSCTLEGAEHWIAAQTAFSGDGGSGPEDSGGSDNYCEQDCEIRSEQGDGNRRALHAGSVTNLISSSSEDLEEDGGGGEPWRLEHRVGSEHEHAASDVQRLLWQGLSCDMLERAEAWMAAKTQLVGGGVETSSRYGKSNSNRDYDNDEDSKTDVNETELASNNGRKWRKEKPERRAKQWSQ
jgi:hypothetical protein